MQPGSEINTAKKHDRHACALTQERHHSVKFEHFLKAWESFVEPVGCTVHTEHTSWIWGNLSSYNFHY